jgi:hypothetical protein
MIGTAIMDLVSATYRRYFYAGLPERITMWSRAGALRLNAPSRHFFNYQGVEVGK